MIDIVVKVPSLSPTLKRQGFSLAPTWVDVSEMQKIQIQKIEELVLYVIKLNQENEALKKRIELIEKSK